MSQSLITLDRARQRLRDPDALPPLDVVTLFAGRWYAWNPWSASFRGLLYPRPLLRVFWYTNSRDPAFVGLLAGTAFQLRAEGWDVRLTVDPSLAVSRNALREMAPGEDFPADHCEVIAALYNRATLPLREEPGRDLFLLEDDLAVPPTALLRLQQACRDRGAGYATAAVYDRHSPALFCWGLERDAEGIWGPCDLPPRHGTHSVGLGPFGCAYLCRWALDALGRPLFKPYPPAGWQGGRLAGCDMVLGLELERLAIPRVCDFDLATRHYDSHGRAH